MVMEYIKNGLGYSTICCLTFSYQTMPHYLLLDLIYIRNKSLLKFKTLFLPPSETYAKFGITTYPNSAESA